MTVDAKQLEEILAQWGALREEHMTLLRDMKELKEEQALLKKSNDRTERYLVGGWSDDGKYQNGVRDQLLHLSSDISAVTTATTNTALEMHNFTTARAKEIQERKRQFWIIMPVCLAAVLAFIADIVLHALKVLH